MSPLIVFRRNSGAALYGVLIAAAVIFLLIFVVFQKSRSQGIQSRQMIEHAKMSAVAKGVIQLVLFKIKVLPSEFFLVDQIQKQLASGVTVDGGELLVSDWYSDFSEVLTPLNINGQFTTDLATGALKMFLDEISGADAEAPFKARVVKCSLLAEEGSQDLCLVRIQVEVEYKDRKRDFEELIKITKFK